MKKPLIVKLAVTLASLVVCYVFPLVGRPELLSFIKILVPVLNCAVIFLTQPTPTLEQVNHTQDRHSMKVLIGAIVLTQITMMIEWAYFRNTHSLAWSAPEIGGLGVTAAGLALRVWARRELHQNFSNQIFIRPDHQLIQTGPFAVLRHPAYVGVWISAIGVNLFLSTWVGLLLTALFLGGAYYFRITHEEYALVKKFGKRYLTYREKTWILIPGVW